MLLAARAHDRVGTGLLLLTPFFLPIDFVANRRFSFWLLAVAFTLIRQAFLRPNAQLSPGPPMATTSVP